MIFPSIVWRNLWRRRTRTLLTVAGVAVGVAAGVAMAGIAWGFQANYDRVYRARDADVVVTRRTQRKPLPSLFDQTCAAELAAMPGIQNVASMLWDMQSLDESPPLIVYGWEPGSFLWDHLTVRSGRMDNATDGVDCVYLGGICAEVLQKKVGEVVHLESRALRVAAVFESNALVENGAAILPLSVLQSTMGCTGKVNFLNVRLAPNVSQTQFEAMRKTFEGRFRGLRVFRAGEMARSSMGLQVAKAMSLATSAIALLAGTLGLTNTLLMSVFERTSEIGLLMAVGWRRRRVVALIMIESLMLSVAGAVVGIAGGIGVVRIMERMAFMTGKIEGAFSPSLIGVAFAIALVLGFLGGLYPAARAASMQPCAALRKE